MRIAAVDLGSNSFHLLGADAQPDGRFVPLVRAKERLRLGDVVSRLGRIPTSAADRAVATMTRFAALAASAGCTEVVACGTSALREAENGGEVVDRIAREAGIEVRVITGAEEARLIFEAVRASVVIDPAPALALDLGGGSLEATVGDRSGLRWAASLKLGAARLTAELVRHDPPSEDDLDRLGRRCREGLAAIAGEVAEHRPRMVVGTSGTLCTLARMALARRPGATVPESLNQLSVTRAELEGVHGELVGLAAPERARLRGLDEGRADIIVAGSTLLVTALDVLDLGELVVSEWALREGIVLDAIAHHDSADWSGDPRAIRRASVLDLCRRCNADGPHAEQVARLALRLFDESRGLHGLADGDRELLEHACLLHDIGAHVSTEGHHKHTAYLIRHGHLRGFAPEEVAALAAIGRHHRGSAPKRSKEPLALLPRERQDEVVKLTALLRLADGLDKARAGAVSDLRLERQGRTARLVVSADADIDVDLWGARRKRQLFESIFDCHLDVIAG